jgi:hypothetical protein
MADCGSVIDFGLDVETSGVQFTSFTGQMIAGDGLVKSFGQKAAYR